MQLLRPDDAGYDEARRTQNDAIDRRPALIARCAALADVRAALQLARESRLPFRVRGGGHGVDRLAVDDDVLVIDLSPMRGVRVEGRRAFVQGGATWRELDGATQAHGLAVTGARIPSVGVAGFTLGSGSGWLERKLGLAADSLVGATVVSADGEEIEAEGELLWALRGGGPGFGVVVELEFELHPVGDVTAGLLGWEVDRAAEIAAVYEPLMAEAADDLGGALAFVPAALLGMPLVAVVVLWTGAGEPPIGPLRALRPTVDRVQPMPYGAFQSLFESSEPYTARIHGEGGFLTGLPPEVVAVLAEHQAAKPAPEGSLLVQPLGGAFARHTDGPLGRRDAPWMWQAGAAWFDAAQDGAVSEWARSLREALEPWSRGEPYPNFMPAVDPARLKASYGPQVWERLRAVRAALEPVGAH
jgi:FAD binding domain-containing protein